MDIAARPCPARWCNSSTYSGSWTQSHVHFQRPTWGRRHSSTAADAVSAHRHERASVAPRVEPSGQKTGYARHDDVPQSLVSEPVQQQAPSQA